MRIKLIPYQDLRFTCTELKVFVEEGSLEHLGIELLNERWYTFNGLRSFFYTITGCTILLEGEFDHHISKYTNLHFFINFYLKIKKKEIYFVIGNGRSTFATTIINFLIRNKKKVLLSELAPDTSILLFNGVFCITLIDKFIEYNKSYELNNTLMYYYGKLEAENDYINYLEEIYKNICNKSQLIESTVHAHFIILPNNKKIIELANEKFKPNKSIIIGDEGFYNQLKLNKKIFIPNFNYQRNNQNKIKEYFYGRNKELTPYNIYIKNLICYKINTQLAPESALPLGAERKVFDEYEDVEPELNTVLAIMDEKGIKPCIGFVVQQDENRMLAPKNKIGKDKVYFMGHIKYFET